MRPRLIRIALAALLGGSSAGMPAQTVSESAMQAAYLANFARFTEWPSQAFAAKDAPIQFCVSGSREALASALDALSDSLIQGHPVRVLAGPRAEDLRGCHVLFVADADPRRALSGVSGSVLTIGDTEGFVRLGGTIGLVRQGSRLRFDVNRAAAQQAGLKLSAQLLSLANSVVDTPPAGGAR